MAQNVQNGTFVTERLREKERDSVEINQPTVFIYEGQKLLLVWSMCPVLFFWTTGASTHLLVLTCVCLCLCECMPALTHGGASR